MSKLIRIGTRDSQLALWQAQQVKERLEAKGIGCELVQIKSDGDLDLVTPIYAMGVQGVFTKTLDAALLAGRIDIAVHSMKDVPVTPAQQLTLAAVLPRGNYKDVLVVKDRGNRSIPSGDTTGLTIATGSIRRKAQWLNRYPHHVIDNLRGNVNTRLRKVTENDWYGAIFAAAGLERLNLCKEQTIELDWMLPAPAQGVICIACRENDQEILALCQAINHVPTQLCATIEREFLQTLMGGCSTPIAALAVIEKEKVIFKGRVLSPDGSTSKETTCEVPVDEAEGLGKRMASALLKTDAIKIIEQIRNG